MGSPEWHHPFSQDSKSVCASHQRAELASFVPSTAWDIQPNGCTGPLSGSSKAQTKELSWRKGDEVDGMVCSILLQPASPRFRRAPRFHHHFPEWPLINLTTHRTNRYGRPDARGSQNRGGCGVDHRVHHTVRCSRKALRQAKSYRRAVAVRRPRCRPVIVVVAASSSSPFWPHSPFLSPRGPLWNASAKA